MSSPSEVGFAEVQAGLLLLFDVLAPEDGVGPEDSPVLERVPDIAAVSIGDSLSSFRVFTASR